MVVKYISTAFLYENLCKKRYSVASPGFAVVRGEIFCDELRIPSYIVQEEVRGRGKGDSEASFGEVGSCFLPHLPLLLPLLPPWSERPAIRSHINSAW